MRGEEALLWLRLGGDVQSSRVVGRESVAQRQAACSRGLMMESGGATLNKLGKAQREHLPFGRGCLHYSMDIGEVTTDKSLFTHTANY